MIHPLIAAAAEGDLPAWAEAGAKRRAHMGRVADLMGEWAARRGLEDRDVTRWRAAAWLHDSLHDADHDALRPIVAERFRTLPGKTLHGPAAAERLRGEGVDDPSLLFALEYHTMGHRELDDLGRALYLADFLEPGRDYLGDRLIALRESLPDAMDEVMREVVAARVCRNLRRGRPLTAATLAFWNGLVDG